MSLHEFNPVIYPYRVWVMIDRTPDEIPRLFLQHDGEDIYIHSDIPSVEAFTMQVKDKEQNLFGVIIYFHGKKAMSCGNIAHEASHAAKFLFEYIGADVKEHEPFEYALGWIAACCEKVKRNEA